MAVGTVFALIPRRMYSVFFVADHFNRERDPVSESSATPQAGTFAREPCPVPIGPVHRMTARMGGVIVEEWYSDSEVADVSPFGIG